MDVNSANPFAALVQSIRNQLTGSETATEIEAILSAAGVPSQIFGELLAQLKNDAATPTTAPSPPPIPVDDTVAPRLIVDWGAAPQIGHQVRPCFMVLSPAHADGQLSVQLEIDDELDALQMTDDVNVISPLPGQWEFHGAFRLTTDGEDCRPGQYLITLRLTFRRSRNSAAPVFFRSAIRLNVNDSTGAGPVLEIDGDGQSIVNLHGHDLRSFGRVVLKGTRIRYHQCPGK